MKKLLYMVLMASSKLRNYFPAHKIIVPSIFPLKEVLHNRDAIGRIAKWAVELGEFDFRFIPRTEIKSQVLADFVAEWKELDQPQDSHNDLSDVWTLFFDGSHTL